MINPITISSRLKFQDPNETTLSPAHSRTTKWAGVKTAVLFIRASNKIDKLIRVAFFQGHTKQPARIPNDGKLVVGELSGESSAKINTTSGSNK